MKITGGRVQYHSASNAKGESEYLGIPYAFSPVGRLRFQHPLRYNGHDIINGTSFVRETLFTSYPHGVEYIANLDKR